MICIVAQAVRDAIPNAKSISGVPVAAPSSGTEPDHLAPNRNTPPDTSVAPREPTAGKQSGPVSEPNISKDSTGGGSDGSSAATIAHSIAIAVVCSVVGAALIATVAACVVVRRHARSGIAAGFDKDVNHSSTFRGSRRSKDDEATLTPSSRSLHAQGLLHPPGGSGRSGRASGRSAALRSGSFGGHFEQVHDALMMSGSQASGSDSATKTSGALQRIVLARQSPSYTNDTTLDSTWSNVVADKPSTLTASSKRTQLLRAIENMSLSQPPQPFADKYTLSTSCVQGGQSVVVFARDNTGSLLQFALKCAASSSAAHKFLQPLWPICMTSDGTRRADVTVSKVAIGHVPCIQGMQLRE